MIDRGDRAVALDRATDGECAHAASVPSAPRPLAASTSARNSASWDGASTSVSACHCTASRNGWRRSSIASIVPSGAHAVATQVLAELVDRLVVEGVDLRRAGLEHARHARARGDPHGVRGLGGELGLAVALDVLVQRAAAGDVERLRAAADAEQRHPHGVGGARQLELEAVELRLGRAELLVRAGAVGGGVEVRPAGEADAVEAVEQRGDPVVQRRQHDGHAAGQLDGPHVGQPQRHLMLRRLAVPAERRKLATSHLRGGDADERGA